MRFNRFMMHTYSCKQNVGAVKINSLISFFFFQLIWKVKTLNLFHFDHCLDKSMCTKCKCHQICNAQRFHVEEFQVFGFLIRPTTLVNQKLGFIIRPTSRWANNLAHYYYQTKLFLASDLGFP